VHQTVEQQDQFASIVGADDLNVKFLRAKYAQERDRRFRRDANNQYVEVTAEFSYYRDDPYVEPGFTRPAVVDEMDVTVIGAGFAGLLAAARLREAGVERVRLVDVAGDVGGTWYWNRYPGAQCDVESYVYLPLLDELDYIPREKYSYRPEIFEHARRIARKFGLYEHALFQTRATSLRWLEDEARWLLETDRGDSLSSRFIVIANGSLSKPKLPAIPGINDFKGHTFHSSRWDYSYTGGNEEGGLEGLADKRVGVIGTGATALQIVPQLGRSARQLYVFQRTPAVVGPRNNRPTDRTWAGTLEPGWQRRRIENFTAILSGEEVEEDLIDDAWTDIYRAITANVVRRAGRQLGRELTPEEADRVIQLSDMTKGQEMRARVSELIQDPATAESLMAWYYLYCKRPGFHDDYLPTFNRPNVELVDTLGRGVEGFTENAVVVNGVPYEVDCLIFATGFEVGTSLARRVGVDPVGRDGQLLSSAWQEGPRTLHGLQSDGFPNMFFLGIVQGGNTINYTHMADEQARHVSHIITEMTRRGASVVEATPEAVEGWRAEMRATAVGQARVQDCTPSYTNSEGDLNNPHSLDNTRYGGGPVAFFELLARWRDDGELPGVVLR
jgi:cation diffusion facilitator CzcD-associated flavoprotein CzcO